MRLPRTTLLLLLLTSLVAPGWSAPLRLLAPDWAQIDPSFRSAMKDVWAQTVARVTDDLADRVQWDKSARASVRVLLSGSDNDWWAIFQLEGVDSAPGATKAVKFHPDDALAPLYLSRALEALCRPVLDRPQTSPTLRAPRLLDTFSLEGLQSIDLYSGVSLLPYGLVVRPNGRLVVAGIYKVAEFDERWMVTDLPAEALAAEGAVSYGGGVMLTSSGTLYVRSLSTNDLWAFPEAAGTHQKVRMEAPAGSTVGVLSDGSPFVVSVQPRFIKVYRDGAETELRQGADSYVSTAAPGLEGTLWLYDPALGGITVTTADGLVRDVIFPEVPLGTSLLKLKVLTDGSFLAVTTTDVRHFDSHGDALWTWDPQSEGLTMSFSTNDLDVSPDGLLYLSDYTGKRILRLSMDQTRLSMPLQRVAEAARKTRLAPNDAAAWWDLAEAYRDQGATEAQRGTLDTYLSLKPSDATAKSRRTVAQVSLVKRRAEAGERSFLRALQDFGPETARESYSRAMKTLEALKALAPQDSSTTRRITALKKALLDAENDLTPPPIVPQVVSADLPPLFPALSQSYRTGRAGTLVVRNEAEVPLLNLRAEVMIPKYMDFATTGPAVAQVAPAGLATLELNVALNDRVLDLEEDLAVQAQVILQWTEGSQAKSTSLVLPVTLYRRSALTWDDSGKLSSFITPNDEAVSRSAFQFLALAPAQPLWPASVAHARAICDALGAFPLRYVPDPKTDFRKISTSSATIDTVRFARTTLAYQGGDCDDTTALLASLLEASGVATAILTSPGHVFLAFDTGEPASREWLYQGPGFATVVHGGTVWLPLESTDLGNGFTGSWKAGSALVLQHRGTKEFEFLPVRGLRTLYPALPLPPTTLPLPKADPTRTEGLSKADSQALSQALYHPLRDRLTTESELAGTGQTRALNRLAQIEARFGNLARATEVLKTLVSRVPDYLPAYTNLAQLSRLEGRADEAERWLVAAEQRTGTPRAPLVAQADTTTGRASQLTAFTWSDE